MKFPLAHPRILLPAALLVAFALTLSLMALKPSPSHHVAYFTRTTGLYEGNEVKILGVTVGRVEHISHDGNKVKVEFTIKADQKVPADVTAAIVAPSLVTGRFIQLAPAYDRKGPYLHDGAAIPVQRTAAPVEFDTVKAQLTRLTTALGPNSKNPRGALSGLIDTAAANLDNGTAKALNRSITSMSQAAATLNNGSGDLFTTVANLQSFVSNLVDNQVAIESFSKRLASVSGELGNSSQQLALTLATLRQAVVAVTDFLNSNRAVIGDSVDQLGKLTGSLRKKRDSVANVLHNVPNLAANATNIIDPTYSAIMGRLAVNNANGIAGLICGAMISINGRATDCRKIVLSLMDSLGLPQTIPGTPGVPLDSPLTDGHGAASPPLGKTLQDESTAAGGFAGSLLGLLLPSGGGTQ